MHRDEQHGRLFFASHLLNLHFAIKVSAAEVLTELLIIKSVPDIPWYSDGAEHLEKGDDGFLQRAGK